MEEVKKAVEVLKSGGVIVSNTDTIPGLSCDAKNADAVKRLMEIKGRPEGKSFVIAIHDIGQLWDYVQKIPDLAWDLVEWEENPLSVVYPKGKNVVPEVIGADGSIAIRLIKSGPLLKILKKFNSAMVTTSANLSGSSSPLVLDQIDTSVLEKVDYVVSSVTSRNQDRVASRIVRLGENGEFELLRK
jgi:L-threonylcarbamoyladenylate synthase